MTYLFDMDSIPYQVAYDAVSEEDAVERLHSKINTILSNIPFEEGRDEIRMYFGNKGNFRYEIYPEYKAQRKKQDKPEYYDHVCKIIKSAYPTIEAEGVEVDDLIADDAAFYTAIGNDVTIIGIDKDFLTIPDVSIYNFNKKELSYNHYIDAIEFLCCQMISGDSADNIKGVPGKGLVFAKRGLGDCVTEQEMVDFVKTTYKQHFGEEWEKHFEFNRRLLTLASPSKYPEAIIKDK